MAAEEWFCRIGGAQLGPFLPHQMQRMAQVGAIRPEELVRPGTRNEWFRASSIKGLTFASSGTRWWWLARDHKSAVPCGEAKLAELLETEAVEPTTVACPTGGDHWKPLYQWPVFAAFSRVAAWKVAEETLPPPPPLPPPLPPVGHSLPTLTWRGKRNALIAFITIPYLLFLSPRGPALHAPGILLTALIATLIGLAAYVLFCQPEKNSLRSAVLSFLFTAITGIFLLLLFQGLAGFAAEHPQGVGPAPIRLFWLILAGIGKAYACAFGCGPIAEHLSFRSTFFAMLTSVGPCEEITKLIPVIFLLGTGRVTSPRSLLFVGALSGLGFGISEGLLYSFKVYPEGTPLSLYLLRFFNIAFGHGVYTLLSSATLFCWRVEFFKACRKAFAAGFFGWFLALLYVVLIALPATVPHALYNAFDTHQIPLLPLVTDGVAVWLAAELQRLCVRQAGTAEQAA